MWSQSQVVLDIHESENLSYFECISVTVILNTQRPSQFMSSA